MNGPESVSYRDTPDQQDAFKRLGGAVVYRWDDLPTEVQTLLLDQATLVGNEDHPGTKKGDLLGLIEQYKRSKFRN
jgi:hypothetical protein